jgi:hypothetical protein
MVLMIFRYSDSRSEVIHCTDFNFSLEIVGTTLCAGKAINKSNLKYYLAILRLMCVNAILTFRAPYEKTLELAHFHTNYGKTNSLKERTSEEMSDNKVLSPDRSET